MDKTTASVLALGILALLVIAFFAVFRGKGKFSIKSPFGSASAAGENPAAVPAGVKIGKANAGGDLTAHSGGAGGVALGDVTAKGRIAATHTPGSPPPKP